MKVLISAILFILFPVIQDAINSNVSPKYMKIIDKTILKVWKGKKINHLFFNNTKLIKKSKEISFKQALIIKEGNDILGFAFIREAKGCLIGGCANQSDNTKLLGFVQKPGIERYEHFDYLLVVNKDLVVKFVKVLDYESDHGYEIVSKRWLRQFEGYKGQRLKYGKDIQAISGATVSAESLIGDIYLLINLLQTFDRSEFY